MVIHINEWLKNKNQRKRGAMVRQRERKKTVLAAQMLNEVWGNEKADKVPCCPHCRTALMESDFEEGRILVIDRSLAQNIRDDREREIANFSAVAALLEKLHGVDGWAQVDNSLTDALQNKSLSDERSDSK